MTWNTCDNEPLVAVSQKNGDEIDEWNNAQAYSFKQIVRTMTSETL